MWGQRVRAQRWGGAGGLWSLPSWSSQQNLSLRLLGTCQRTAGRGLHFRSFPVGGAQTSAAGKSGSGLSPTLSRVHSHPLAQGLFAKELISPGREEKAWKGRGKEAYLG